MQPTRSCVPGQHILDSILPYLCLFSTEPGFHIRKAILSEAIAQKLAADLDRYAGHFPPLKALAQHYGVSPRTISRAAHLLAQQGQVSISQGRTIRASTPGSVDAVPSRPPSAVRTSESIADQISTGQLRSGETLPKVAWYVREYGVSNATVAATFRILEHKKLIHKAGRRWIVGPRSESTTRNVTIRSSPVIVLVTGRVDGWRWLHTSERTQRFCASFVQEAERLDIEIVPVLASETSSRGDIPCAGLQPTLDLIRKLGPRYAGMLLAARRSEMPEMQQWIGSMAASSKPVVWFDALDEPLGVETPRNFTRCHFNEHSAIDAALQHLSRFRHRWAGYVIATPDRWIRNRFELLRQKANDLDFPLRLTDLHSIEIDTVFGQIAKYPQIQSILTEPSPQQGLSMTSSQLVTASRHLLPLLDYPEVSTLIACNDSRAMRYYRWFRAIGLRIPHDISLISFDNSIALNPLPISSVDFGFGTLGYSAFHLILRDIPVKCDRRGHLSARARVIDRGSVGPVGKHRTLLRSLAAAGAGPRVPP